MSSTSPISVRDSNITYIPINVDPVPVGLRELACDISAAVLRAQPIHIYSFVSEYLHDLLLARDKRHKSTTRMIVRSILDEDLTYEAMLTRWGVNLPVANYAATLIQAAYRGHRARLSLEKCHQEERSATDTEEHQSAERMLQDDTLYWEVANRAAICIQRTFRKKASIYKHENPPGEPRTLQRHRRNIPPNVYLMEETASVPTELTASSAPTAEETGASLRNVDTTASPPPSVTSILQDSRTSLENIDIPAYPTPSATSTAQDAGTLLENVDISDQPTPSIPSVAQEFGVSFENEDIRANLKPTSTPTTEKSRTSFENVDISDQPTSSIPSVAQEFGVSFENEDIRANLKLSSTPTAKVSRTSLENVDISDQPTPSIPSVDQGFGVSFENEDMSGLVTPSIESIPQESNQSIENRDRYAEVTPPFLSTIQVVNALTETSNLLAALTSTVALAVQHQNVLTENANNLVGTSLTFQSTDIGSISPIEVANVSTELTNKFQSTYVKEDATNGEENISAKLNSTTPSTGRDESDPIEDNIITAEQTHTSNSAIHKASDLTKKKVNIPDELDSTTNFTSEEGFSIENENIPAELTSRLISRDEDSTTSIDSVNLLALLASMLELSHAVRDTTSTAETATVDTCVAPEKVDTHTGLAPTRASSALVSSTATDSVDCLAELSSKLASSNIESTISTNTMNIIAKLTSTFESNTQDENVSTETVNLLTELTSTLISKANESIDFSERMNIPVELSSPLTSTSQDDNEAPAQENLGQPSTSLERFVADVLKKDSNTYSEPTDIVDEIPKLTLDNTANKINNNDLSLTESEVSDLIMKAIPQISIDTQDKPHFSTLLSSKPESLLVVELLLESMISLAVSMPHKPTCIKDPVVAASASQQVSASAGKFSEDSRPVKRIELESLYTSPQQTHPVDHMESTSCHAVSHRLPSVRSLDGGVTSNGIDSYRSLSTIHPASGVTIKVESQEFYEALETLSRTNQEARLSLDRSSNSLQTYLDSTSTPLVIQSEIDMTRTGNRPLQTTSNYHELNVHWSESGTTIPDIDNAMIDIIDNHAFTPHLNDYHQNIQGNE